MQFMCLALLQAVFLVSFALPAQDFWTQKSYKQWTKGEIVKIISDSPWAQVREVEADITNSGSVPNVTIRLRSAIPIRQALVRLRQIEAKYDKMDEKKRADFDQQLKGTLDCPACQENYVITISPPISTRMLTSGVFGLKRAAFSLLQGKVYLINDKNEKRELVHFIAPKSDTDEAVLFFPRRDENGNVFLTDKNKSFSFVFDAENIPIIGGEATTQRRIVTDGITPVEGFDTIGTSRKGRTVPRQVTFDVSKLLIDGKVEF
jgi:hypothetical protein